MSSPPSSSNRFNGIDVIRGVVMILMAIDHVRLYGGVPAGGADAGVFFTRWITHFCAPAFVFLAGTSAFLHGRSIGARPLAWFLLTRGLLLVALELTVVKFSWGFNLDYASFTLAGVIWMIGWCMVLMAAFIALGVGPRALGCAGIAIIVLQPIFGLIPRLMPASLRDTIAPFWEFMYPTGAQAAGNIQVLYVIVPWIGVMAAGYGFGALLQTTRTTRTTRTTPTESTTPMKALRPVTSDTWCWRIGAAAIALFLAIAIPAALAQGVRPQSPPLLFRVLGQNKYPASLLFLLMTLGPVIALLPLANRATGWFARVCTVLGRAPMFYYLLHIPTIHFATLGTAWLRGDGIHHEWYRTAPYASIPATARWHLWEVYLVFLIVVAVLYFPTAWYVRAKSRSPRPRWMSYL